MSIRPSPALVVPGDLSIGDCARKMRDHDVGSLIVVRPTQPHDLIGIFTERDLVKKIDEVQHGGYWEKSISTIMSHPVITISIYELGRAAEMMSHCYIRHLPVVYEDEKGQQHLAGMISMRDLFDEMVERQKKTTPSEFTSPVKVKVMIASRDETSRTVLKTLFSQSGKGWVEEVEINEGMIKKIGTERPEVLVLDLDFVAPGEWASLLHALNHERNLARTIIIFTPGFHAPKNVEILNQLKKGSNMTAYAKPINILEVLQKAGIGRTTHS